MTWGGGATFGDPGAVFRQRGEERKDLRVPALNEFTHQTLIPGHDQSRRDGAAASSAASKKRKTLEELFRPPIDLMHKGSFKTVSTRLSTCL